MQSRSASCTCEPHRPALRSGPRTRRPLCTRWPLRVCERRTAGELRALRRSRSSAQRSAAVEESGSRRVVRCVFPLRTRYLSTRSADGSISTSMPCSAWSYVSASLSDAYSSVSCSASTRCNPGYVTQKIDVRSPDGLDFLRRDPSVDGWVYTATLQGRYDRNDRPLADSDRARWCSPGWPPGAPR